MQKPLTTISGFCIYAQHQFYVITANWFFNKNEPTLIYFYI